MTEVTYMTEFTFQREWVEKRGFLLVLAFFLGGLGGGLYLASLYLDFHIGMVTGFLIVAVGKGGAHLAYLGKPLRFWRGFLKPQSSWISRGLLALALFLVAAALQLAPTVPWFSWLPWTSHNLFLQVVVIIGALGLVTYTGFALGVINAIPFWNTSLMPLLFLVCALSGGLGLALGMGGGAAELGLMEKVLAGLLIIVAGLLGLQLLVAWHTSPAAKQSVKELAIGKAAPYFMGGVVVIGLVLPLAIVALAHQLPIYVISLGAGLELVGGFCLRYSILKAGIYSPLI